MAQDINQVVLVGRLTNDIELKQSQSVTIASFNLAVNGYKDQTDFIRCTAFNKTAEILNQYAHKGSRIGVTGRIHAYSYDKQDGSKAYVTEVTINSVQLLDSKHDNQGQQPQRQSNRMTFDEANDASRVEITDEDLPF